MVYIFEREKTVCARCGGDVLVNLHAVWTRVNMPVCFTCVYIIYVPICVYLCVHVRVCVYMCVCLCW